MRYYLTFLFFYTSLFSSFANSEDELLKDNIIIVLDASGSMNESMGKTNRLNVAKKAIITVVQTLNQNSNIALLVFSGVNKPSDWLHPLGSLNLEQMNTNLRKLSPGGGTPLGAFMQGARKVLESQKKKQLGYGTYRMLILTDGHATDNKLVLQETPLILGSGIYLDVIGVAMNQSHALATKANSYRSAMDQNALMQAMKTVLSEVGNQANQKDTQETFDILEPLDHKMAAIMIKGLASNPGDLKTMISQAPGPKTQIAPKAQKPVQQNTSSAKTKKEEGGGFGSIFIIAFAVIVFLSFLRKK
jgi:hypothetical protein